jgi:hypothetical protein
MEDGKKSEEVVDEDVGARDGSSGDYDDKLPDSAAFLDIVGGGNMGTISLGDKGRGSSVLKTRRNFKHCSRHVSQRRIAREDRISADCKTSNGSKSS